jgi:hypothetical protein
MIGCRLRNHWSEWNCQASAGVALIDLIDERISELFMMLETGWDHQSALDVKNALGGMCTVGLIMNMYDGNAIVDFLTRLDHVLAHGEDNETVTAREWLLSKKVQQELSLCRHRVYDAPRP